MRLEVIAPRNWMNHPERMVKAVELTLDMLAEGIIIDFQVTTRTWKTPVMFVIKSKQGERRVFTTSLIYKFVAHGTRVRYAIMTPNFRAKSVVNQIRSRVGRGGVAFISRKHPRPGIQARKFDTVIAEKWKSRFVKTLQLAIDVEVQKQNGQ